jgi:SAM-dependent methyltransferase
MNDYIHGATREAEIERLEKQARFVAPWSLAKFEATPGMQVLDLGTGIGAMARELSVRHPGIVLTGVDRSLAQLETARLRHPVAHYVEADATRLPFAAGTFDRVHASWLLEHVAEPAAVVAEVFRVLRPGGVAHFVEVDNATLQTEPSLDSVTALMRALNEAQLAAGGDPYIGRRLGELLCDGGFARAEVEQLELLGNADDPAFYAAFIAEFAEIFESVRGALGAPWTERIAIAVSELKALLGRAKSSMRYRPVVARALR